MYQEEIKELDGHSAEWRRVYFIRNLIRTLMEIESTIHGLRSNGEFVRLLADQSAEVQHKFEALFRAMQEAHDIVKHTRNTICGHVKHQAVQRLMAWIIRVSEFSM